MREILLPRVDSGARHRGVNRHEPRYVRETVVAGSEERELMTAQGKRSFSIDLVLLAMLGESQQAVSTGNLHRQPRAGLRICRTPSGYEVVIVQVSGEFRERFESRTKPISDRKILRVISVPHIESAGVGRDISDSRWNQQVRIGIAIAMGIRRQIVLKQKITDLDVLCNRLAVVACDSGGEVLRRFYAARRGFRRKPWH